MIAFSVRRPKHQATQFLYASHVTTYICCSKIRKYLAVEIKCQLDAKNYFYCRSYCLRYMFRAPLCPSSGTREYYTGGCCLSYLVLWFSSFRYGVELRVMCPYCLLNMFRAPLCPSLEAREYYTGGCCLWYLVLWFSSCRYGVVRVMDT